MKGLIMSDSKTEALDTLTPTGTYLTYVRPHQLKRTDTYNDDHNTRSVVVESVAAGEILYRGRLAPVLFVTGYDRLTQRKVLLTKTAWEFMEVQRIGDAPPYQHFVKALDQYVY
jgi:hypothetical protein